jgi:hypothetical protein
MIPLRTYRDILFWTLAATGDMWWSGAQEGLAPIAVHEMDEMSLEMVGL